ncbi:unnamed protein product [marine sediment metagenome]|uniref:Uncharacterized protein n=1 Tax=marine sediment metagenome TaxID=412755 RepID=X1R0T8_9ZZZZ
MGAVRHRRGQRYSAQEKKEALFQLDENGGNFEKTARETGITVLTLQRWRGVEPQELEIVESEAEEKFRRYIWKNIFSLSSPVFINKLKAKALEKGSLKDVCMAISILRGEVRRRLKTSEAEPEKRGRPLTAEDLQKLIDEEERKLKNESDGE